VRRLSPAVRNAENKVLNRRIPEEMAEIEDSQQSGRICSILTKLYGWDNPTFKNAGVIMNLLAIRLSNSFTDKSITKFMFCDNCATNLLFEE